ncbi:MAG TPA: ATP-binding cassette domain-containing protein [Gemmatimonadaceae bacterium]|nr:ATP-binding cassette domain-containing protein [Gemmatimonadaceae bacterium]
MGCFRDPIVVLTEVTKHFVVGIPGCSLTVRALESVSLAVPAGAAVVIVGPRGSGKSTLALCIAGLLQPDSGVVRRSESTRVAGDHLARQVVYVDALRLPHEGPAVAASEHALLVVDSIDHRVTPATERRLRRLIQVGGWDGVVVAGADRECRAVVPGDWPRTVVALSAGRIIGVDGATRRVGRVAEQLRGVDATVG